MLAYGPEWPCRGVQSVQPDALDVRLASSAWIASAGCAPRFPVKRTEGPEAGSEGFEKGDPESKLWPRSLRRQHGAFGVVIWDKHGHTLF